MSPEREQIVHTLCFHTRDALTRDEGRFTFKMPGDAPRLKAIKIALGSLEFPMVQWTIEREWNLMYVNEGIHLTLSNRTFHMRTRALTSHGDVADTILILPQRLNPIVKWRVRGDRAIATCAHPHGLWSPGGGSRCLADFAWWGDACIVASPLGTVHLRDDAQYVSDLEFSIVLSEADGVIHNANDVAPRAGCVYFPDPPSLNALCEMLNTLARNAGGDARVAFDYNAGRNRTMVALRSLNGPQRVSVITTPLSILLGLGSAAESRTEEVGSSNVVELVTEPVAGWWSSITLPPGWYGPSHRPMCTMSPRNLHAELEFGLNRLNFGLPESVVEGSFTSHFLVFVDPSGSTLFCPVPVGRYDPDTLCSVLERGMTLLSRQHTPGVEFSVVYRDDRFAFACEVRDANGRVRSAPFVLAFNHKMQFEPERIGFDSVLMSGSASYASVHECRVWASRNIYRVGAEQGQDRLRVHGSPSYSMLGVVLRYEPKEGALVVRTHVGQLPASHGLAEGDVVRVVTSDDDSEIFVSSDDGWMTKRVRSCPLSPAWDRIAPVLASKDDKDVLFSTVLRIRVRANDELNECVGATIGLAPIVRPFNMCLGSLSRSIPPHLLGAEEGAMQWGIDGACVQPESGKCIAPYVMPFVHSLDHPDYVLMYLDEGKRSTLLQHAYGAHASSPFCKLVLYPLFREERMLPRDTTMISGESLTTFTIRFTNADGSPYKFHGAEFSFSLNLVKVQDA